MGLGDLTPDNKDELVRDKMKDASSDDNYPKFQSRVPYMAIWTDDEGNYHAAPSPQNHTVQYIKESKSKGWRPRMIDDELERYWMDQYEFKRIAHIVDDVLGLDIVELLQDDPEAALDAIIMASKHYQTDVTPTTRRKCGVCGERLHLILDKFEEVGNRIVCSEHTASEIASAGLL